MEARPSQRSGPVVRAARLALFLSVCCLLAFGIAAPAGVRKPTPIVLILLCLALSAFSARALPGLFSRAAAWALLAISLFYVYLIATSS